MNTDNMENTIESGSIEIISVELQSASLNSETVDLENSNLETESLSLQGNIETGIPGKDGVSVIKVEQIQTATEPGGINKIRIYLSDNSTFDFTVKNGTKYTLTDEDKQTIVTAVNAIISPTLNTKADKSEIPTKVSQLTNDKGYLTQHQSLVGYAKTTDLPTKLSQLFNDCNYLTQHQSLSEYLTKALAEQLYQPKGNYLTEHQDISGKQDVISDLEDIRNKANSALQEHQSLDGYVPKISDEPITIIASEGNITIGNIENPFDDFFSGIATLEGNTYIRGGEIEFNGSIKVSGNEFKFNNVNVATERWVEEQQYIDISALNGYATQKWVEDKKYLTTHQSLSGYAKASDIPTKTSDITNDSGFIDANSLPTAYSDLTNDLNYQTLDEINTLIENAIAGIAQIQFEVVDELPETGVVGTFYLISSGGTTPDIYDEYIYFNNAFEKVGSTKVDLSDYVHKSGSKGQTITDTITFTAEVKFNAGGGASDICNGVACAFKVNRAQATNFFTQNIYTGKGSNAITFYTFKTTASGSPTDLVQIAKMDSEGNLYEGSTKLSDKYLQEHQDISGKANANDVYTKTEIDAKIGDIETLLDNIIGE